MQQSGFSHDPRLVFLHRPIQTPYPSGPSDLMEISQMVDVISTGDHAIKAQDNSALALLGPDALTEFRNYSRMMSRPDAGVPILAGLSSDNDLLAQLADNNTSDHSPPDRPSVDRCWRARDQLDSREKTFFHLTPLQQNP